MPKYHKGFYTIKNKEKYIGKRAPIYRSGWEATFMQFCDFNPNVLQWASESIAILYQDPLTGKKKNYYPDFLVIYNDKDNIRKAEIVEIKPSTQTGQTKTKSKINNAAIIRNHAKWAAALQYAEMNGLNFRLITENELFGIKGKI